MTPRNGKWKMENAAKRHVCRRLVHSPFSILHSTVRAFTLVEMITVVAIIALLLAISIPGMTAVWEERKMAQAVTIVRGLLASTRAQALRTSERGLFFFVDPVTGAQRIVPIVAEPPRDQNPNNAGTQEVDWEASGTAPNTWAFQGVSDAMAVNRFWAVEGQDVYTLPAPIRVAPRDILDTYGPATAALPLWPEPDIARTEYNRLPNPLPPTSLSFRRNRNFFAIVFDPDGRLLVGRDVLIHDHDREPAGAAPPIGDDRGDRTGLFVKPANKYFLNDDPANSSKAPQNIDPAGNGTLCDMVVEVTGASASPTTTDVALNFRSVDGLLVYDESILADIPEDTATANGLGTEGKRGYLIREGRPIYISRLTGDVIEGPKNEP